MCLLQTEGAPQQQQQPYNLLYKSNIYKTNVQQIHRYKVWHLHYFHCHLLGFLLENMDLFSFGKLCWFVVICLSFSFSRISIPISHMYMYLCFCYFCVINRNSIHLAYIGAAFSTFNKPICVSCFMCVITAAAAAAAAVISVSTPSKKKKETKWHIVCTLQQ